MVYRLTLSYIGTAYAGWQRQRNALCVQQVVEEALEPIVGAGVRIVGAGRTDAGVHARGQVAHLELDRPTELRVLLQGGNHHLPADIRILRAETVVDDFHARKSALAKEYRYRLSRAAVSSPFESPFCVRIGESVDVASMRVAASCLTGRHDFTAFAVSGGSHSQPFRKVLSAAWQEEGRALELRIVGDGFLRGMVRGLVGTMLEVGEGKRTVGEFEALLAGRPREEAGPTAPARGLVLWQVYY